MASRKDSKGLNRERSPFSNAAEMGTDAFFRTCTVKVHERCPEKGVCPHFRFHPCSSRIGHGWAHANVARAGIGGH